MSQYWTFQGTELPALISEERDWEGITLKFRVDEDMVESAFRSEITNAGDIDIQHDAEGGFEAVDMAAGRNTFTVSPPDQRADVRYMTQYLADVYSDEMVDQKAGEFEVKLDLVASSNKTPQQDYGGDSIEGVPGYGESGYGEGPYGGLPPGYWGFILEAGSFVTDSLSQDMKGTRENGADGASVKTVVNPREAKIIEESLGKLEAVNIREVGDGSNVAEDNSPDKTNTIHVMHNIDEAESAPISEGMYVVGDWGTRWENDEHYEASLTLLAEG